MQKQVSIPESFAHADKIDEILVSLKKAFALKGFDGASMQDLAKSAGMSAGNFYRYFPSKDAIIAALVERELAKVEASFADILRSPNPAEAFLDNIGARLAELTDENTGAIWSEIEATARRRDAVGETFGRLMSTIHACLMRVFSRLSSMPESEARLAFSAHADFILLMLRGAGNTGCADARAPQTSTDNSAVHALVLRSIRNILIEISNHKRS